MQYRLFCLACLLWTLPLLAFQAAPASDSTQGVIEGRVVQSKTGEPIKKALVVIQRRQDEGIGAVSDAEGRFRFERLESGPYTISVDLSGFFIDPQSERQVIDVIPRSSGSEVTLKMLRAGAISGRVTDVDGDPVIGANIQASAVIGKAKNVFGALTDDRGEYRIYNIPPGKYRIAASWQARPQSRQVKMQGPKGGSWAVTWYPAALDRKLAQTLELADASDVHGIDIQLQRATGVTIRGTVVAGAGAPPGAISFVTLSPIPSAGAAPGHDQLIQNPGGAFEIGDILPGTYVLSATAPLGQKPYSASRIIQIGNTDIDGVQLLLGPPQTLTGVVVPPEGRKLPPGLIALFANRDGRRNGGGGASQLSADGSFQIANVAPGDYDVIVANTGPGDDLYVSAIEAGDTDALSAGVHVGGQPVEPLRIRLKANGGTVQANVVNKDGKPQPDMNVNLLPDSPRRNEMALYGQCKTDSTGTCQIMGVTPGSYHVFAFADDPQIDFRDADATKEFEDSGKAVKIAEGERQSVELNPVPDSN